MGVRPKVVVVGSGFGGLAVARRLAGRDLDVTVIDRNNYHGFWPLLYQVATAGLGPEDIAWPIRAVHAHARNVTVRMGTVTGVDLVARSVAVANEPDLTYDYLVIATGSTAAHFDIPGVADHTFSLKTLPDAVRLRNHLLTTFESAAADPTSTEVDAALTTVLVGGGPTGVELAGALSELIAHNLAGDFTQLDVSRARVVLVEMSDRLLSGFADSSSRAAFRSLTEKGVELRLDTRLASVDEAGVTFADGSIISTKTVVWTAGIQAGPLAGALGAEQAEGGTVVVNDDLSLQDNPEVFVIGDLAAGRDRKGRPLPQVAQVAIQGGRHAAKTIEGRILGRAGRRFRYHDHGMMATIGRRSAVADIPGGVHLSGTLGWLAWLGVHLLFLVGFRNRVVVMVNWSINYLTWDRASRVILDDGAGPAGPSPGRSRP